MRRFLLVLLIACGGSSSSSNTGGSGQQTLVVRAVGVPSSTIPTGGTLQLAAYHSVSDGYGGATLEEVTANWSSSNTAVATVDSTGLVTGVADGMTVITASDGMAKGQFTVTVGPRPPG
jgi:glucosylceramidase